MEQATKKKLTVAAVLGAMGPGLLAALSGNDAGGIATYSSAGASYGYATLWMLPVMALLLIVVQETAARCGCVTGKGFASLIREKFGARKTALAMVALLIANTAVTISEFAGIASGLALFGIPKTVSVPLMGLLIWLLTMSGSFRRIEKILLLVSCVFVTYVVAAFLAGPNWGEVALSTVTPHLISEPSYVSLLVATIGTTIAPWMIFLAQNNVVDKNADRSISSCSASTPPPVPSLPAPSHGSSSSRPARCCSPRRHRGRRRRRRRSRAGAHRRRVCHGAVRRGSCRGELLRRLRAAAA
ncbi:MAG: Nramp family divalent metal transporter [Collinsella sp.]